MDVENFRALRDAIASEGRGRYWTALTNRGLIVCDNVTRDHSGALTTIEEWREFRRKAEASAAPYAERSGEDD